MFKIIADLLKCICEKAILVFSPKPNQSLNETVAPKQRFKPNRALSENVLELAQYQHEEVQIVTHVNDITAMLCSWH